MDAFDREARGTIDDLIAAIQRGEKREVVVERLAVAMRAANHQWRREQAMAPVRAEETEGADNAA